METKKDNEKKIFFSFFSLTEKEKFSLILSVLALFLSISSLIVSQPFSKNADIVGIAVTLLCGLVTLLIGWNIYNIIDIKTIRQNIATIKKEANDRNKKILAQTNEHLSTSLLSLGELMGLQYKDSTKNNKIGDSELLFKAIKYRLSAAEILYNNAADSMVSDDGTSDSDASDLYNTKLAKIQDIFKNASDFFEDINNNNTFVHLEHEKIEDLIKYADRIKSFRPKSFDNLIKSIKDLKKNWMDYKNEGDYLFESKSEDTYNSNYAAYIAYSKAIELIREGFATSKERGEIYIKKGSAKKRISVGNIKGLLLAIEDIKKGIECIENNPKNERILAYAYSNLACIYAMLDDLDNFNIFLKEINDLETDTNVKYGKELLQKRLKIFARDYLTHI